MASDRGCASRPLAPPSGDALGPSIVPRARRRGGRPGATPSRPRSGAARPGSWRRGSPGWPPAGHGARSPSASPSPARAWGHARRPARARGPARPPPARSGARRGSPAAETPAAARRAPSRTQDIRRSCHQRSRPSSRIPARRAIVLAVRRGGAHRHDQDPRRRGDRRLQQARDSAACPSARERLPTPRRSRNAVTHAPRPACPRGRCRRSSPTPRSSPASTGSAPCCASASRERVRGGVGAVARQAKAGRRSTRTARRSPGRSARDGTCRFQAPSTLGAITGAGRSARRSGRSASSSVPAAWRTPRSGRIRVDRSASTAASCSGEVTSARRKTTSRAGRGDGREGALAGGARGRALPDEDDVARAPASAIHQGDLAPEGAERPPVIR